LVALSRFVYAFSMRGVALPAPAGAVVGGQVRHWDAQRGVFELAFDNGSVELAYLPQPSVNIVDARGTVLNWETFFLYCRSVGMCAATRSPNPEQTVFRP
jgi:hypothetical protein